MYCVSPVSNDVPTFLGSIQTTRDMEKMIAFTDHELDRMEAMGGKHPNLARNLMFLACISCSCLRDQQQDISVRKIMPR